MSNFRIEPDHLSRVFRALGNPHRVALLSRLMTCCVPGTRFRPDESLRYCVGDLGEGLDIAPSTLSHHLKELQGAGLIRMQRRGRKVECWVDPEVLEQLARYFGGRAPES